MRIAADAARDAVVADALASGRALCERDGSLARDRATSCGRARPRRTSSSRAPRRARSTELPSEMGAYLAALAPLLPRRALALDAGTGDGRLLEVLGPVYERVVAVDRSDAQLARARERVARARLRERHPPAWRARRRRSCGERSVPGRGRRVRRRACSTTRRSRRRSSRSSRRSALPAGRSSSSTTRGTTTSRCAIRPTLGWASSPRSSRRFARAAGSGRSARDDDPRAALRRRAGHAPAVAGDGGEEEQRKDAAGRGASEWRTTTR